MQAIIMAAGKGSRIGNRTKDKPKAFIEINGKKLIEYNVILLKKLGIEDIIIVTGYQEECFRELFAKDEAVHLVYNPFYELMNVIGSFYMGMGELREDFLYLHADTLCEPSVFEDLLKDNADISLPYDPKPCDGEAMKIRSDNGIIVEVNKTMDVANADGEFIGIARFSAKVLDSLKKETVQVLKEKKFDGYFEEALQKLINENAWKINPISVENRFWIEIDFEEDLERAKRTITDDLLSLDIIKK